MRTSDAARHFQAAVNDLPPSVPAPILDGKSLSGGTNTEAHLLLDAGCDRRLQRIRKKEETGMCRLLPSPTSCPIGWGRRSVRGRSHEWRGGEEAGDRIPHFSFHSGSRPGVIGAPAASAAFSNSLRSTSISFFSFASSSLNSAWAIS
jgi:hypothetical protein